MGKETYLNFTGTGPPGGMCDGHQHIRVPGLSTGARPLCPCSLLQRAVPILAMSGKMTSWSRVGWLGSLSLVLLIFARLRATV